MTTLYNQRAMRRVSPNSHVRRRLFADEPSEEARTDNFANILQESIATENAQKMIKWNFDFKNEVPLEGDYEWYQHDGEYGWIGMKPEKKTEETTDPLPMQTENETTPKSHTEAAAPLVRKRRNTLDNSNDKGEVKRKLSFDNV